MNKSIKLFATFLALFIFLGCGPQSFAQNFEGIIHYQFPKNGSGKMGDMQYMIKNNKARWQFEQGDQSGALLYLPDESKMIFLIDKMHSYIKMDMDKAQNDSNDSYGGKWKNSKLVKTGETKSIAGHNCEIWEVTNTSGDKLTMCMAKDLGKFITPGNPMNNKSTPDWAKEIMGKSYMPLEVIEASDGNEDTKMEAISIEKKSLDESLFEIPDGYQDMSAMMKQMKNQKQHQQ